MLQEADAWGNKLLVQIDPKNNTYRIASAGRIKVIAFITDFSAVDRIIDYLKLAFVAYKPASTADWLSGAFDGR